MSYSNRFIRIPFDELGEGVYVEILNPRTAPPSMLLSEQAGVKAIYEIGAGLVRDWRVYDATSMADEQPLLGLPATPESFAKLPWEIISRVNKEIEEGIAPH